MVRICVNRRMKQTTEITKISADFFCVLCKFLCSLWFSPSIGANLCQSVDRDAKVAKDTKGAKGNAKTQRKQRRRGHKEKATDYTDWHRFFCGICEICGFNHPIGVNLCQSVDRDAKVAKGNAKTQRKQRRRGRKEKNTDYTDWHRFFCGICEICGFNHPIGVNLCQSVDRDAKVAKDTKGAKGNARAQRKQRRRGHKEKNTDYTDWHRFFCGICEICGFNHPIGVNLCQSVDVFLRNLWFLLAETEQLHFFL